MRPLGYYKMYNFGYVDLRDVYEYGSPTRHGGKYGHRVSTTQKYKARRYFKRFERFTSNTLKRLHNIN